MYVMSRKSLVKFIWQSREKLHLGPKLPTAGRTNGLTTWPQTIISPPWVSCALRALKKSRLKSERGHRTGGWPSCPSFSSCPGPKQAPPRHPRRSRPKIPHVGRLETPRSCSGSCWWTAASTCRDAASLWRTRPGRVRRSQADGRDSSALCSTWPVVAFPIICRTHFSFSCFCTCAGLRRSQRTVAVEELQTQNRNSYLNLYSNITVLLSQGFISSRGADWFLIFWASI